MQHTNASQQKWFLPGTWSHWSPWPRSHCNFLIQTIGKCPRLCLVRASLHTEWLPRHGNIFIKIYEADLIWQVFISDHVRSTPIRQVGTNSAPCPASGQVGRIVADNCWQLSQWQYESSTLSPLTFSSRLLMMSHCIVCYLCRSQLSLMKFNSIKNQMCDFET